MSEFKWPLMKNSIDWRDKLDLVKFILSSNLYTQGEQVKKFEDEWSDWLGAKYSLFVTSGSTANFLLVSAVMEKYDIKPGDKVLLPACTWMTNVAPPIQLGLTPVFCDVNLSDFSFKEESLREISQKHPDIKLVFITHLLGIPADKNKIQKYFPEAIYIDDVCESHGCFDNTGSKIGSNSLGATFSFYFGHHMTTVEGGMISTNDFELYDLMRVKRSHGLARNSINYHEYASKYSDIEKSFLFVTDGYNFRNTEFSAVLGLSQLKKLNRSIDIRRKNYEKYFSIIEQNNNIFYNLTFQPGNSCFCFPFICKSQKIKAVLINLFNKYGIEYRPVVSGNLLRQPFLKNNPNVISNFDFTVADLIHNNGVYIGNNQFVTDSDMKLLFNVVEELKWILEI